jgi:recombination protein RecT
MSENKQAAAPRPPAKLDALKKAFDADSVQEQFKNALQESSGIFIASVIDLYGGDSYLQKCNPNLVIMEALKAAVLKLPINKSLGFAYIVPYKKGEDFIPQFQLGYKGMIQLALRTNQYRIIHADRVYEGEYVSSNKLTGEYDLNGKAKSETVIGYFAHFEMLNGFSKTLYMPKERVISHAQKYSKSYKQPNGPWTTEFDGMAIKTVVRGLLGHWGMLSPELIKHMDEDVADRVESEINGKANQADRSMGFNNVEEAHMVGGEEGEEGPGY